MTKTTVKNTINDDYVLQMAAKDSDMAAMWDSIQFNSGFLVVRPSALSQQLYQMMRQIAKSSRKDNDQNALNKALRMIKRRGQHGRVLQVNVLDRSKFVCGVDYFEKSGRMFPKPFNHSGGPSNSSERPLVVHNNWIVSKEAKIYRFREHLMWLYDGNDQYYSSETRKYLTYTNAKPTMFSATSKVIERELSALKTALAIGYLLNRVVILPRFHCPVARSQCPLNSLIHIKTFDSIFSGRYRESSFLRHPKVPDSVKHGVTDHQFDLHVNQTSNIMISSADIRRLFSELSAKVLNLNNLLPVRIDLNGGSFDQEFSSRLQSAFRRSSYRQFR